MTEVISPKCLSPGMPRSALDMRAGKSHRPWKFMNSFAILTMKEVRWRHGHEAASTVPGMVLV